MNFAKLRDEGIRDDVLTGVNSLGFIETTPVQEKVIPLMLDNKDVLVQAPTGTGKTAAFGIPIINLSTPNVSQIETLILTPTRELAMQVSDVIKKMASGVEGLKVAPIYGGQNLQRQLAYLRKKPQIIVATTGRIVDHIKRKTIKLDSVKRLILDEVDVMLDMGFRDDIDFIYDRLPKVQTAMFSATIPQDIASLSKKYQDNAVCIKTTVNGSEIPNIKQFVLHLPEERKYSALKEIIWKNGYKNVLVFCNTKVRVETLNNNLNRDRVISMCIHGDMHQKDRDRVMKLFKNHDANVLVATDVASRGLDIEGIEAIINYDVPFEADSYVHRIGRTARANKNGVSYIFSAPKDKGLLDACEREAKTKFIEYVLEDKKNIKMPKQDTSNPKTRFFINVGSKDGADKPSIENFICAKLHINKRNIYDYNIKDIYSFIDADAKYRDKFLSLNGEKAFGRILKVDVSSPRNTVKKNSNKKPQKNFNKKPVKKQEQTKKEPQKPKSRFYYEKNK